MYTGKGKGGPDPCTGEDDSIKRQLFPFISYIVITLESNGDTFGYVLHTVVLYLVGHVWLYLPLTVHTYITYTLQRYTMDVKLDAVRIMQCKECGVDVPVNVNYPITEVTCQQCWAKRKADKK